MDIKYLDNTNPHEIWPPPPQSDFVQPRLKPKRKFLTGYEPLDAIAGLAAGALPLWPTGKILLIAGHWAFMPPNSSPSLLSDAFCYGLWGIATLVMILVVILFVRRYPLFVLTFVFSAVPADICCFGAAFDASTLSPDMIL